MKTVKSFTARSLTMKPGIENADTEKSVFKNFLGRMSDRKTLQNKNRTTKTPAVNISTKKAKSLTARK